MLYGDLSVEDFEAYDLSVEPISWVKIHDETLEHKVLDIVKSDSRLTHLSPYDSIFYACEIFPVSEDSLSGFLPTTNINMDLTNTMAGWTFTTPFSNSRFTGAPVD